MPKATNRRDQPHARIYAHWSLMPAWRNLSLASRALLIEILLEYRPGLNGSLQWSCRKAARAIRVSKDRAARALNQLEMFGWLKVERVGLFGRCNAPSCYSVTVFANDATGEPPSYAFEHFQPNNPLLGNLRVAPQGQRGRISGTAVSHSGDAKPNLGGPVQVSAILKSTPIFNAIATKVATEKLSNSRRST